MAKIKFYKPECIEHSGKLHEYEPGEYHEVPYFHAKQMVDARWGEFHPDFKLAEAKAEPIPELPDPEANSHVPSQLAAQQLGEIAEAEKELAPVKGKKN